MSVGFGSNTKMSFENFPKIAAANALFELGGWIMSKVRLPVIVGMGGINAAGRSSRHHGYRRMVLDSLSGEDRDQTLYSLASMTGDLKYTSNGWVDAAGHRVDQLSKELQQSVRDKTLIRRLEKNHFDVDKLLWYTPMDTESSNGSPVEFVCMAKQLPSHLPENWAIEDLGEGRVKVLQQGSMRFKVSNYRQAPVQSAGQLPSGFDPSELYASRFHPRGLQMSVVAASDALNSMGLAWSDITARIPPDQLAVYSGSVMAQLDGNGYGGLMQARLKGGRVSSKQLALGLNTMPADFVNAYVLGSVGATGSSTGACATFLYNLRMGVEDIQSGRRRVVFVGNAEAPLTPEVFEGYAAMGALATDEGIRKLDGAEAVNHRRSSRPFGHNCGFTLAESAQYIVLMDDELAVELGAQVFGAVSDVFINADGYKKSISAPGPGNYITLAKAVASAQALLGEQAIQQRSMVQSHGSSTPANRVTESRILDRVAGVFDIKSWPVAAVKSYVGHSLAPASADQMMAILGQFAYGWMPGIKTIDSIAEDVYSDRLNLALADTEFGVGGIDVAFINSKGFGGNNASACVLSPQVVMRMLDKRYGRDTMKSHQLKQEGTEAAAHAYEEKVSRGDWQVRYRFGEDMIDEAELELDQKKIKVPGFKQAIDLPSKTVYGDMI